MRYYKIPIINAVFDYPVGCVLCCAYPQGTDMICKFETCPEVGPGWVEITAEEFEANCPDFSQDLPVPEVGVGSGATPAQAAQIQANADAIADIQDPVVSGNTAISGNTYTLTMPRDSGAVDTVVVEFDADGHVSKVNENGRVIPWTTTGV